MTSTQAACVDVWQQAFDAAIAAGLSAGSAIREADRAEAAWLAEQVDPDAAVDPWNDEHTDAAADVDE